MSKQNKQWLEVCHWHEPAAKYVRTVCREVNRGVKTGTFDLLEQAAVSARGVVKPSQPTSPAMLATDIAWIRVLGNQG